MASSADQPHRIITLPSKVKQTDNWTTVAGAARTCHGPEQDAAARPHPVPGVQLHRAEVRHTRKQLAGHQLQFAVSGGWVPQMSAPLAGHMLQRSVSSARRKQLLGGLKIGCKRLFLHSPESKQYLEMMPDCVLDFYVHESCQRAGIGRTLLEVSLPTHTSGHLLPACPCMLYSLYTCLSVYMASEFRLHWDVLLQCADLPAGLGEDSRHAGIRQAISKAKIVSCKALW
jgi:GNAT superfamily N-acetyltransferase